VKTGEGDEDADVCVLLSQGQMPESEGWVGRSRARGTTRVEALKHDDVTAAARAAVATTRPGAEAHLTVGVSGEHSEAVRVHCTPG